MDFMEQLEEQVANFLLESGSTVYVNELGDNLSSSSSSGFSTDAEEDEIATLQQQSPPPPPVWSWTTSFQVRQYNMLQFGFFSDFNLMVGVGEEPKKQIRVHKAILASASQYFYNEIIKVLAEGVNELELDDDPRIFTLFLRYLYTGGSGANFRDAFLLQKLAKKYEIPDLIEQCDRIITKQKFTIDIAYALLPVAINAEHKALTDALMKYVCKNGDKFIKDKKFESLPKNVILEIIKKEDLKVLYETTPLLGVVNWGKSLCKEVNGTRVDENLPQNFGPFITDLLPFIRFPCDLTPLFWYADGMRTEHILGKIFKTKHNLTKYNNVLRKYSTAFLVEIKRHEPKPGEKIVFTPWRTKNPRLRLKETLMFHLNIPFVFYGFTIVKGIFGEDFSKHSYDYNDIAIHISIITSSTTSPDLELKFTEDDKLVIAHFKEQVDLPAYKWVTLSVIFSGFLKRKPKNSSEEFTLIPLSSCTTLVVGGMRPHSQTVFTPIEVNMLLPMICSFRRASASGDQPPIDKGFIHSLLFSFTRPYVKTVEGDNPPKAIPVQHVQRAVPAPPPLT